MITFLMKGSPMKTRLFIFSICATLAFQGCGKKPEPFNISTWERHQDPYFKVTFSYPKGWHIVTEGGKASVFSSPEVVGKFYDPTSKDKIGAQLVVSYQKLDTVPTVEAYVNSWKGDLTSSGFIIKSVEPKTIDGSPGTQVHYSGRYDENTNMEVVRLITIKDSILYYFQYGAFNELFDANRSAFDSLLASVRLPQPKSATTAADATLPSKEFDQFSNNFLQISYPNNFETSMPQPKGGAEFSLELRGYRQDCTIHIDVLPAKGLSVEKVVEQNQKFFRPTSRGQTTIDGTKAMYLNYSPAKNVESRVYFLVKKEKVYRMIINYYQPMKKDYLPVFEKTIASVHVK